MQPLLVPTYPSPQAMPAAAGNNPNLQGLCSFLHASLA